MESMNPGQGHGTPRKPHTAPPKTTSGPQGPRPQRPRCPRATHPVDRWEDEGQQSGLAGEVEVTRRANEEVAGSSLKKLEPDEAYLASPTPYHGSVRGGSSGLGGTGSGHATAGSSHR
ncbi:unnamed protein product [Urochloa humidicola]